MGSGRSDLTAYDPEKYGSLRGYARDIVEVCRELGLSDVVFVGHSVSAMIGVLALQEAPELFGSLVMVGPNPRYIDDGDYVGATQSGDARLQTSSVIESTHSGTVLIGSSREQVGFDDTFTVEVLRQLAAKAVGIFPFLAGVTVLRSYGGFRPYLPDHLPAIGPDLRMPGLWHASGHEGAGIGLSVATGELIRDLVLERPTQLDPAPFGVQRASLAAHLAMAGART